MAELSSPYPPHAEPDRRLIEAALEHVLGHPDFRASGRLSAFLRFIVTETLEGRADRLKAFSIAVTVYGRDDSFDPQASSIVRVEATRLRRMLERHFREDGRDLAVEIRIPKGRYIPEFIRRADSHTPVAPALHVSEPEQIPTRPLPLQTFPPARLAWLAGWVVLFLLGAAGIVGLLRSGDTHSVPAQAGDRGQAAAAGDTLLPTEPTVAVLLRDVPDDPPTRRIADRIKNSIEHEFERADDVAIIERIGDGAMPVEYRVDLALEPSSDRLAILRVRVTHAASGELIWSRSLRDFPLDAQATEQDRLASEIGLAISRPYGLIFTDYRGRYRQDNGARRPFSCIIRAFGHLQDPGLQSFNEAMACLDTALAARPDFASAAALRAMLIADDYVTRVGNADNASTLEGALTTAQRAVAVDPQRTRPHLAMAMAQYLSGNLPGYERSIARAVELNPADVEAVAQRGATLVLSGKINEGVQELTRAVAQNDILRDSYAFHFFLAALMRNDQSGVQTWGRAAAASRHPSAQIASIVAAHRRGDIAVKQDWANRLQKSFPAFASDLRASFERMGMVDTLAERLLAELADAGLSGAADR